MKLIWSNHQYIFISCIHTYSYDTVLTPWVASSHIWDLAMAMHATPFANVWIFLSGTQQLLLHLSGCLCKSLKLWLQNIICKTCSWSFDRPFGHYSLIISTSDTSVCSLVLCFLGTCTWEHEDCIPWSWCWLHSRMAVGDDMHSTNGRAPERRHVVHLSDSSHGCRPPCCWTLLSKAVWYCELNQCCYCRGPRAKQNWVCAHLHANLFKLDRRSCNIN